jgi:REP element-mobilizing transposase RayT
MPTGYNISDQTEIHFLTFGIVGWIDLFTRLDYRNILVDSLNYCQKKKGLEIFAWVIMSNHVHLLCRSIEGDLSGTIRDLKKYTGRSFWEVLNSPIESRSKWMANLFLFEATKHSRNVNYQIWTHDNHAEEIYSNKFIDQKIDYIHNNPVKAGIVIHPEDYLYSSARDYCGEKGLIEVIVLK